LTNLKGVTLRVHNGGDMGIAGASQILTQEHIAAQSAQEKIVQEFVEFHGKGISKTSQKFGDPTLETGF